MVSSYSIGQREEAQRERYSIGFSTGAGSTLTLLGKRKVLSDSEDDIEVQPAKKATPKKPPPKKQMYV